MCARKTLKEIKSTLAESIAKEKELSNLLFDIKNEKRRILNDYMETRRFKDILKDWVLKNKKMVVGLYLSDMNYSEIYYLNDDDFLDILNYTIDIHKDVFPSDISIYLKDITNKKYYKYSLNDLADYYSDFVTENKELRLDMSNINHSVLICKSIKEFTENNYYQSYIETGDNLDFRRLFLEIDKYFEIVLFDRDEFEDNEYEGYEDYVDEDNPVESKWEAQGYKLSYY